MLITYPQAWNFAQWDTWAKTQSPNPNVKIYLGAPASSTAAGSGFVDAATIASILRQTQSQFSSFGGAMLVSRLDIIESRLLILITL